MFLSSPFSSSLSVSLSRVSRLIRQHSGFMWYARLLLVNAASQKKSLLNAFRYNVLSLLLVLVPCFRCPFSNLAFQASCGTLVTAIKFIQDTGIKNNTLGDYCLFPLGYFGSPHTGKVFHCPILTAICPLSPQALRGTPGLAIRAA